MIYYIVLAFWNLSAYQLFLMKNTLDLKLIQGCNGNFTAWLYIPGSGIIFRYSKLNGVLQTISILPNCCLEEMLTLMLSKIKI